MMKLPLNIIVPKLYKEALVESSKGSEFGRWYKYEGKDNSGNKGIFQLRGETAGVWTLIINEEMYFGFMEYEGGTPISIGDQPIEGYRYNDMNNPFKWFFSSNDLIGDEKGYLVILMEEGWNEEDIIGFFKCTREPLL